MSEINNGDIDAKDIKEVKPQLPDSETPYQGAACVICLDTKLSDPTILDSCLHFFCYECINQWLLTNPSCPMCKKHLNKIKHNLSPLPETFPVPYNSVNGEEKTVEDLLTDYEMGFLREQSYSPLTTEKRCVEEAIEKLYHKTIKLRNLESDGILSKREIQEKRDAYEEKVRNLTALKSMMNNRQKRGIIYNTPDFRRLVYSANLSPRSRLSPRFPADATSNGIIANEALFRKRLIPFLLRELTAIIPRAVIDMSTYLDLVIKYLKSVDRNAKNIVLSKLHSAGIEHPLHFLNNISHFLASGQRLDVYDENCEYRVRGSGSDIRSYFQNDSDNDVEFLNETITIGNPRRPLEQWADNMRTEYFRSIATNPPAPVSAPQVITINDSNDRDPIIINDSSDPIVIEDERPIVLSDDEEGGGGGGRDDGDNDSDNNMFAHPDLLIPSYPRRIRTVQRFPSPTRIFRPFGLDSLRSRIRSPTSPPSIRSRSPTSALNNTFRSRNRSPTSALNSFRPRNRSPTVRTDDYADLNNRLNIFDGLGPFMRNIDTYHSRLRHASNRLSRTPSPIEIESPPRFSVLRPTTNTDEPRASSNATESDSDVEIVSQTTSSNTRKRPRYDDAH